MSIQALAAEIESILGEVKKSFFHCCLIVYLFHFFFICAVLLVEMATGVSLLTAVEVAAAPPATRMRLTTSKTPRKKAISHSRLIVFCDCFFGLFAVATLTLTQKQ